MRRPLIIVLNLLLLVALIWGFGWHLWQGTTVPAVKVTVQPLKQWVVASGEVRFDIQAQISAEITGTVKQRHVREGDLVTQGQLLLSLEQQPWLALRNQAQAKLEQLDSLGVGVAQVTLEEAQKRLALAQKELTRRQALAAKGLVSTESLEQTQRQVHDLQANLQRAKLQTEQLQTLGAERQQSLQALSEAQARLDKTMIYAPFAGRILQRNVEQGDVVQPQQVLFELASLDSLEVVLALDEKSLAPIALGQPAWIIADAYPEREIQGKVSFIAPALDSTRGTIDVHLRLEQPAAWLRSGMTVSTSILTQHKPQTLVLDNKFLRWQGKQAYVWRYQAGQAQPVFVELGIRSEGRSEISQGLAADDLLLDITAEQAHQRLRPKWQD
ncbi:efflux RND transporter periplasmic adaptor subunit [Pseudomonas sp. F1_0610]|uniref:efflux RND transporter periplasmic adaptor subunit n=1 Tax=Pseudomonas sp. F1_0610 TaxID=3114284 RepID=UPI0039C47056